MNGRIEKVRALLRDVPVDASAHNGTALHQVARSSGRNRLAMTKLLLDAGANIEARDQHGRTALANAVSRLALDTSQERLNGLRNGESRIPEDEVIVRLLLDRSANPNITDTIDNDMGGWTPLHDAAWGGADKAVRWLIDAGANVNARNKAGATPLDKAMEFKCSGAIAILQGAGAKRGSFWRRIFG